MADYSNLKNKFKTDDTPTGDDYGELIQLAGDAKDTADAAVPDNGDGSVTINKKKIIPASKDDVVSDNKDNTITVNGKTYVPVADNQDGTITVNTQTYVPADASKVAYASSFDGTDSINQGSISSTQQLSDLQNGTYGFGQTDTEWPDGPEELKGLPRWGSINQWAQGSATFQKIYTNQNEEYWRQKSGAPAQWGEWNKNAKKSDIDNSNSVSNQYPFRAIISSFSGPHLTHLDLYWTNDYETFYPINKSIPNNTGGMRDPSIAYFDNRFWIAYTWGAYYSYDLIDFTPVNLPVIKQGVSNWAPEWVVDGDNVYLMATMGSINNWGSSADFKSYWCKFDYASLTFTNWQALDYANPTGIYDSIDNTATFYKGYWWLAMKDEYHLGQSDYSPIARLYKSSSPISGYQYVTNIPFSQNVEGPSLIVVDGIMICFADAFEADATYRMETNDGTTWVNEINVVSSDGSRTQHFTVLPLTSDTERRIVQKAISYYQPSLAGNGVANLRTSIPRIPLKAGVNDLYPRQGIEYYYHVTGDVANGSLVEVNLHMDYNQGYSKIHFAIDNGSGMVTLRINRSDAFYPPQGAPYWETTLYDTPVTLISVGSDDWGANPSYPYRIVSAPSDRRGGRNYLLGTAMGRSYTAPGKGINSSTIGEYQLSSKIIGKAKAGQPVHISFDMTVENGDSGRIFMGFVGGGPWGAFFFNRPWPTGSYHVSQVFMLPRDLILGDTAKFTVDDSAATYSISNVMFELGTEEHEYAIADEDPQATVKQISIGSDTNLDSLPADGVYPFGGTISWTSGPKPISGQARWGYVNQVNTGGTIFQTMYTSSAEIFFRLRSGYPARWSDWFQYNLTQVGTV